MNNFTDQQKAVNTDYIFGIRDARIYIVQKNYWEKYHHLEDAYISKRVNLPEDFYEDRRSIFYYEKTYNNDVLSLLSEAGFQYSLDLSSWMQIF